MRHIEQNVKERAYSTHITQKETDHDFTVLEL